MIGNITRWVPASGLLAAVALALNGLISSAPPVAGAAGAAILASNELPRWLGMAALVAAAFQAVSWISFFAPPGILAAGALPDIAAFGSMLAWLVACSITMLVRSQGPVRT